MEPATHLILVCVSLAVQMGGPPGGMDADLLVRRCPPPLRPPMPPLDSRAKPVRPATTHDGCRGGAGRRHTTLLLAQPGSPQAKESARELAKSATVAYNLGNYEEAAAGYESAYRLVQDPVLLYNIGQSYRLAGRLEKALAAYKGFLRTAGPDDPTRPGVTARVAELEATLAERKTAPPSTAQSVATAARPLAPEPPTPAPSISATPPPFSSVATNVYETPAPAAPETPSRFRTTAGASAGWGGRANSEESAVSYHIFARVMDPGTRVYELGYVRRPVYPMNPVYQFSVLYGVFRSPRGWHAEAGALGAQSEWLLGGGYGRELFDLSARLERVALGDLCGASSGALVYFVPEGRLRVPVSRRFKAVALGSYRGKLSTRDCRFHPSLLTLDLSGDLALSTTLTATAGVGHYGLFALGPGVPLGPWPSRTSAAEHVHAGGRYAFGRVALIAQYRFITYAGGSHELGVAMEFRSRPDSP